MTRGEYVRRAAIAVALAAGAVVLLWLLDFLASTLLVLFAGLLFGVVLDGAAREVHDRTGLGQRTAVLLLILLGMGTAALLGWWLGPRVGDQVAGLAERIPRFIREAESWIREQPWGPPLLERMGGSPQALPSIPEMVGGVSGAFSTVAGAIANLLLILFLAIYLAWEPPLYERGVAHLVPAPRRERMGQVLGSLAAGLRSWMVGQLASMGIVGVLTTVGLILAGVPLALALGLIATLFSFVPFIGPILSAVPAVAVGLTEGVRTAAVVVALYGGVQLLESNLITPLIQRRVVSLPPAVLVGGQVVMGVLFGLIGVFMAAPLTVAVVILIQVLYVEGELGDDVEVLGS